ncbi:MAG: carboxypeptidase regulatory-like domain-containing protein [Anaerolineales bacterium]|nr:carboxypeptidase regulatory-like domain-containing protein [Anaerolineales bacterium]
MNCLPKRAFPGPFCLLIVLLLAAWLVACSPWPSTPTPTPLPTPTLPPNPIFGVVQDEAGVPVRGAVVRARTAEDKIIAGDGAFILGGFTQTTAISVTAWAEGYYVGGVSAVPGGDPVTIMLKPYYTSDNPDYDWFSHEGAEGSLSCSHCMPCYEEWQVDAHSQSAVNPRFLTMYNGADVYGNYSPPTRFAYSRDYGSFPLHPDPNQPYYGPGYKLDFPETAGNCSTCHLPGQAAKPGQAYAADPNQAAGIEKEGVFCEFCHKVGAVTLDPSSGLPYPNMPGVLSMRLFRPYQDEQLFFGNFDDVTRRVSYLPLYEQSAYCAACHYGVFWDTVIYNSYGEWLESPYSDPQNGETCQDCHMPPVDYDYFVYPEKGGLIRDRSRIFSHRMPGASDEGLLQNAVSLTLSAWPDNEAIIVEVRIVNDRTGHHVPTDSPLRHLILLVQATDAHGAELAQLDGPRVPEWGGVGDPQQGYYAGLPGKAFAKLLEESWTGIFPSGAYWNPTRIVSDNRLAAFAADASLYTFAAPPSGDVDVEVKLIFRRAFIELMDQKGWDAPDILMAQQSTSVNR